MMQQLIVTTHNFCMLKEMCNILVFWDLGSKDYPTVENLYMYAKQRVIL